MTIKILDCTLRDGGYYTDWDFDAETVKKYLSAISTAKVDVLEIGFRFLSSDQFLGAFAFSTDEYLNAINLPEEIPVAVMVNASELINYKEGVESAVERLFLRKKNSPVDIVRIAARPNDVEACSPIAAHLYKLGYRVFLNMMQVDALSVGEITRLASVVNKWGIVEVLYFADSFGNMDPDSVKETISSIRQGWDGLIGVHAHDNKGQALINSLAAFDNGVSYIDATMLGMGRGAGNTKLENLLVEVLQRSQGKYFPDALFPLALQEFSILQEKHRWGPNIYYFLSAIYGIHPTYIQEMLSGELYDIEQVLAAINFLKSSRAPFYSLENMINAITGVPGNEHGKWSAAGWAQGRDVLILAPGPGTSKHMKPIQQYVSNKNPIVLCLNVNSSVPEEIVTAHVACHETRILIEIDLYTSLTKPIILPLNRVPESIRESLDSVEIRDFGLRIDKDSFQINNNGCILNNSLSLFYAIAVATAGGANNILLSGVDGYERTDPRYQEVVEMFEKYSNLNGRRYIQSITPTSYPIPKRSIYDPDL